MVRLRMTASDYAASIEIPEDLIPSESLGAAEFGYAVRLSIRKAARDAGLTKLPRSRLYIGGGFAGHAGPMRPVDLTEEDLTVMLPGEE